MLQVALLRDGRAERTVARAAQGDRPRHVLGREGARTSCRSCTARSSTKAPTIPISRGSGACTARPGTTTSCGSARSRRRCTRSPTADVDVIVLKGTAFAISFYADMGLRPMRRLRPPRAPGPGRPRARGAGPGGLGAAGSAARRTTPASPGARRAERRGRGRSTCTGTSRSGSCLPTTRGTPTTRSGTGAVPIEIVGRSGPRARPHRRRCSTRSCTAPATAGATRRNGWPTPSSSPGRTRSTGTGSSTSHCARASRSRSGARCGTSPTRSRSRCPGRA